MNPESEPLMPYKIHSKPPELNWPELRPNDTFIILMLDVGFGKLKGLAVDFPRNTKVYFSQTYCKNI